MKFHDNRMKNKGGDTHVQADIDDCNNPLAEEPIGNKTGGQHLVFSETIVIYWYI